MINLDQISSNKFQEFKSIELGNDGISCVNQSLSNKWLEAGKYLLDNQMYGMAEFTLTNAFKYDNTNFECIIELSRVYAINNKHSKALNLTKIILFQRNQDSNYIYKEMLKRIFPEELIQNRLKNYIPNNLEQLIKRLDLDDRDSYVWFSLSIALDQFGFMIYANQAYENSIALQMIKN